VITVKTKSQMAEVSPDHGFTNVLFIFQILGVTIRELDHGEMSPDRLDLLIRDKPIRADMVGEREPVIPHEARFTVAKNFLGAITSNELYRPISVDDIQGFSGRDNCSHFARS
jgi:hypothetical protein